MPVLEPSGFDSFGQEKPTHDADDQYFPQGDALRLGYSEKIKKNVTLVGSVTDISAITPTSGTLPLAYAIDGLKPGEATGEGTGVHAVWNDTANKWISLDDGSDLAD